MKKIAIFGVVMLVIFAVLAFVVDRKNEKIIEGNAFMKENLHPDTVAQLNDPLYQNIILPEELEKKLQEKEDVLIYFYSPSCPACKEASPIIVPLADELGFDMKLYNLLEFSQGWEDYRIEGTPTVLQFKNGEEVNRIVGLYTEDEYRPWFEQLGAAE